MEAVKKGKKELVRRGEKESLLPLSAIGTHKQ